jgi:hypothetical protein
MRLQTIITRDGNIIEILFFSKKNEKNSYCRTMARFENQLFAAPWDIKTEGGWVVARKYDGLGKCSWQHSTVRKNPEDALNIYHKIVRGDIDVLDM